METAPVEATAERLRNAKNKIGICEVCGRNRLLLVVDGAPERCDPLAYPPGKNSKLSHCMRVQQSNMRRLGRITQLPGLRQERLAAFEEL